MEVRGHDEPGRKKREKHHTEAQVSEENRGLDAKDVEVVHDLDCHRHLRWRLSDIYRLPRDEKEGIYLDEVDDVGVTERARGKPNMIGPEDVDVDEVADGEGLSRLSASPSSLTQAECQPGTYRGAYDEVVVWTGVLDDDEAADASQYHDDG